MKVLEICLFIPSTERLSQLEIMARLMSYVHTALKICFVSWMLKDGVSAQLFASNQLNIVCPDNTNISLFVAMVLT